MCVWSSSETGSGDIRCRVEPCDLPSVQERENTEKKIRDSKFNLKRLVSLQVCRSLGLSVVARSIEIGVTAIQRAQYFWGSTAKRKQCIEELHLRFGKIYMKQDIKMLYFR
jgi:hypothetical protein